MPMRIRSALGALRKRTLCLPKGVNSHPRPTCMQYVRVESRGDLHVVPLRPSKLEGVFLRTIRRVTTVFGGITSDGLEGFAGGDVQDQHTIGQAHYSR